MGRAANRCASRRSPVANLTRSCAAAALTLDPAPAELEQTFGRDISSNDMLWPLAAGRSSATRCPSRSFTSCWRSRTARDTATPSSRPSKSGPKAKIRLGPGTLYEAVQRLEDAGYIEETAAAKAPENRQAAQRRYYGLTLDGWSVLRTEMGHLARLVDHARAHPRLRRADLT